MRKDLPVYVTVGQMDPVGGGLVLVDALVDRYRAAGLTDITVRVWPGARHEVFNETQPVRGHRRPRGLARLEARARLGLASRAGRD